MSASPITEYRLISRHLRRPLAWAPAGVRRPQPAPGAWCCDPGCDGFDDELAQEVATAARRWLQGRVPEAEEGSSGYGVEPWQRVARFRLICRHCRGVYFSVDRPGG